MRRLEAAALVDGYIDEYSPFLHQRQHIFGNQLRSSITRNEHRANDDVNGGQFVADVMLGRIEGMDVGRHLRRQLFQSGQRHVGNGDVSSHACGNAGSSLSNRTTAQDEDFSRFHAGHASHQLALAALGLLQVVGTVLRSHTSCHLAHRDKQRQRAVVALHRLVSNTGSSAFQHGMGQFLLAGKMEIGEDHLSLAYQGIFGFDGLFDLDYHVGLAIDILDGGQHLRTHRLVVLVAKSAALPCSMLHIDGVSTSY